MSRDYLLLALPDELCDEAIAQLIECLYELARCLENHYAGQLWRYYDAQQRELWPEQDPPF
jgi:hypothetical protein